MVIPVYSNWYGCFVQPPFVPNLKSLDSYATVSLVSPKDFGSFIDIELNLVSIFMGLLFKSYNFANIFTKYNSEFFVSKIDKQRRTVLKESDLSVMKSFW